ncbi:DMT family transporter [Massilia sp. S19_KUP03_FR1]|uniref:DMT family transporter n=1 Tax=Massilia sp. S19_KUP03_FR1 TaxID=3025503 RepID=UPI002FCD8FD8
MNSVVIAWVVLGASVISEVAGTVALRQSVGFTKVGPALLAGLFYAVAVWLMAIAMRQLEMGVTYAVWAASGTVITALVGIAIYNEHASLQKFVGILLVLIGVFVLSIQRDHDI